MTKYLYGQGIDPIAALGLVRPFGDNVLVKAIMPEDFNQSGSSVIGGSFTSAKAEAFEILAVGGGVAKWCKDNGEQVPEVGMHCEVRSTAADRLSTADTTGRYWCVPVSDIAALHPFVDLEHPGLMEQLEHVMARQSFATAIKAHDDKTSQVDLEAAYRNRGR